jgi:hypothetical protein
MKSGITVINTNVIPLVGSVASVACRPQVGQGLWTQIARRSSGSLRNLCSTSVMGAFSCIHDRYWWMSDGDAEVLPFVTFWNEISA